MVVSVATLATGKGLPSAGQLNALGFDNETLLKDGWAISIACLARDSADENLLRVNEESIKNSRFQPPASLGN